MSLSGAAWISVRTAADSSIRALSLSEMAADSVAVAATSTAHTIESGFMTSILQRRLLFPDTAERHDDVHRLLHVLPRHPFEAGVEVVLAGKEVRRRQAHEREPRTVRPAANRPGRH